MVRNSIRPKALVTATALALIMSGGAWAQAAKDTGSGAPTTEAAPIQPGVSLARLPIEFEANQGQHEPSVAFLSVYSPE